MTRDEIENITPQMEMLARMWIVCDPNRDRDSQDQPEALHVDGEPEAHPRWMWFLPRAQASAKFIEACGFRIVPVE